MQNKFDFLANLPYFVFGVLFLAVLVLFAWALVLIFTAKGAPEKNQKGRKLLFNAFIVFFSVLLIVLIFFITTALLDWGAILKPQVSTGEFPNSPTGDLPAAPVFIKLSKYYLNGPFGLKNNAAFNEPIVYAILCKNAGKYDIIFIDQAEGRVNLLVNQSYGCWMEKCGQNLSNLSIAVLRASPKSYNALKRKEISDHLQGQLQPACSLSN